MPGRSRGAVRAFPDSRPARRGEYLEIYATGLGSVSRLQGDGQPKTPANVAISRTPVVTIGGVPAAVTFSGLAPGGVGLFQINAQIPDGALAGSAVPVTISLNGGIQHGDNHDSVVIQARHGRRATGSPDREKCDRPLSLAAAGIVRFQFFAAKITVCPPGSNTPISCMP